jgi:HAMP domain-containing protein
MGANSPTVPATAPGANAAKAPDIRDLHGLAPLTFWERRGNEVIFAGVAAVVLLAAIVALLLRKKSVPPLTPIERARQELAAARALLATAQDQAFAITVSGAVRHYLENAFHIPAPEQTTEEFLQETMRHDWLKGELTDLLRRFLGLCDLAKFAGQQYGPAEREQLLAAATEFVEAAERLLHPPSPKDQKNPPAESDDDSSEAKPTAADLAKSLAKVSSSHS